MEDFIKTRNGHLLSALKLETYPKGILWFCQKRLVITDFEYNEITSLDVIDFIQDLEIK